MAQIHVQPKRKSYWWVWLLLVLIALAVLIYFTKYRVVPPAENGVGNAPISDTSSINHLDTNVTAQDSALYYHNGITGQ